MIQLIESKFMKKLTVLIVTLLIGTLAYCQESFQTDPIKIREELKVSDWTEYYSNDQFDISYKFVSCEHNIGYNSEYVFLKIENKTSSEINLVWNMDLYYNGECLSCGYEEYKYSIKINPNSIVEGQCEHGTEYTLKLYSKFVEEGVKNKKVLTAFQLSNLKTSACAVK